MKLRKSTTHRLQTLAALFIAVAVAGSANLILQARAASDAVPEGRPPMPVLSAPYVMQDRFEREQRFLGLVQAATRSEIGFEVPGAIREILVREGQSVAEGTALAALDTAALKSRRAAARASVDRVQAELELARARTERQAPLSNSGAISAQTFDDTRLTEKALVSGLAAANAQLQSLDIDLEHSVLRAPYPARIGRQLLDRGAVTQPGAAVFTLVSSREREAHIGIAVEQAAYLTPGESYPLEWRGRDLQATLRAVRPDVNPVSMTTVAIFTLPGDVDAFDGEPVAVSLPRSEAEEGGWVPLSALLEGERGVWTVLALRQREGSIVALREVVEVLHVSGSQAYVRGSLNAGDEVIVDGVHRIAPGTRVDASARARTELARR